MVENRVNSPCKAHYDGQHVFQHYEDGMRCLWCGEPQPNLPNSGTTTLVEVDGFKTQKEGI